MGHDEDKNNFGGGTDPVNPTSVTPNPRAQLAKNRIGMRPARNFSAQDELNRISGVTTQTQTTGGDIVLNNGVKKKNKLPIIIVAVLVIVGIIIAIVLLAMKTTSLKTDVVDSGDFIGYLLNGDSNIQTNTHKKDNAIIDDYINNDDLIYPFTFYNMASYSSHSDKKIEKYFSDVQEKYNIFREENEKSSKKNSIDRLGNLITVMEKSVNYEKNLNDIAKTYINDKNSTKNYFEKMFRDFGDDGLEEVSNMQKAFYESVISVVYTFESLGCYVNGMTSYDCVLASGNMSAVNNIDSMNRDVDASFRKMNAASKNVNREIVKTLRDILGK